MGHLEPTLLRAAQPKKICVLKPSAFGDVIQALPILPVLREAYPRAQISWLINRELRELVEAHPCVDQTVLFDRRGSWWNWYQLARHLRERQFDLIFDLQGLLRTGVMALAAGAPLRVGLETAREGSRWAMNCLIPGTASSVPAHERYWQIAEILGLGDRPRVTTIPISSFDTDWAREQLTSLRRPWIAVHAGARWVTKCWPPKHFAAVLARAAEEWNAGVILVGSKSELPMTEILTSELLRRQPQAAILNLAGRTTLKQLAAVLKQADLLLSNDSGPMHLAAGLGTPVVGVFTCTDPVRSGPGGTQHELVSTSVPCRASYHKKCPLKNSWHLACHRELDVDRVWFALQRLVERHRLLDASRAA